MMKSMIVAVVATVAATAASAGGYIAPVKTVEPVVAVAEAPAFSWSGAYAGVSVGKTGTALDFSNVDVSDFDAKETSYGVFGGYRHQFDNKFVVGGEVNYAKTGDFFEDLEDVGSLANETDGVELQAGYAFDRVLPYAFVGKGKIFGEEATSFGVGVDYAATENVIVGVKYTRSDLGEFAINDVSNVEVDVDTVALRVGYKF